MKELKNIKIVISTITLLILGLLIHVGIGQKSNDRKVEIISQTITNAHSNDLAHNNLSEPAQHIKCGASFIEFDPAAGTIQNAIYRDGSIYTSTDIINSENVLLGQN